MATGIMLAARDPVAASQQPSATPTTPVVVRDGVWYLRNSNTSGPATDSYSYGNTGDIPIVGRWDHHGEAKPGVVRGAAWYLRLSNSTGVADVDFHYGNPWDVPLTGDWDGDGVDTPGVFRDGMWHLRNTNSTGTADISFQYGDAWDLAVVGDWDGDGVDSPGVVRHGVWYLRNTNTTGVSDTTFPYGEPADEPFAGDWNGDGRDTPGIVRGSEFHLRNTSDAGIADINFIYGNPGDTLPGQRPAVPMRQGDEGEPVLRVQTRLESLGFWLGPTDGVFGDLTEQAVYAFDKFVGLPVDGAVDEATVRALGRSHRAQAVSTEGDLVEVDKNRQLVFIVRDGRTVAAFNASTGDGEPYTYGGRQYDATTPTGRFEIFRQIDGWRTSHLGRLYRPKYFTTNGIALHGSTFVPPYATSHGCVRLTIAAIDHVWNAGLAPIGIDVWVYGSLAS